MALYGGLGGVGLLKASAFNEVDAERDRARQDPPINSFPPTSYDPTSFSPLSPYALGGVRLFVSKIL